MDNMGKLSHWMTGEQVTGTYHGVSFAGKLTAYTRPTATYDGVIFDVALSTPIKVFGMRRASIEVYSTDTQHTLSAI